MHASPVLPAEEGPRYGTYAWPVLGRVIGGFEEPSHPYGPGHRGIDIAAPIGTEILAPSEGIVAFAGWVAGSLFVSIDHPDGVRTTYSWLSSVTVKAGQEVRRGHVIGTTGHGHAEVSTPHLHFGARIGDTYIDPLLLLGAASVVGWIHLAPLDGSDRRAGSTSSRSHALAPHPWRSPNPLLVPLPSVISAIGPREWGPSAPRYRLHRARRLRPLRAHPDGGPRGGAG